MPQINQCDSCQYQTINKQDYQKHSCGKHTDEPLTSDKNETQKTVTNEFKIHVDSKPKSVRVDIEKIHERKDDVRIKCGKCDYVCSLNIQLKKHTNSKHADDCCEQCNYKSENQAMLKRHIADCHAKV